MRFEYHPETKQLYLVRDGVTPVIGELLAIKVNGATEAKALASMFMRGYREGTAKRLEMEPAVILNAS